MTEASSMDESDYEVDNRDLKEEIHALTKALNSTPPPSTAKIFSLPPSYKTFMLDGEKDNRYVKSILKRLIEKKGIEGKFNGHSIKYAQVGPPNAPHFIGKDTLGIYIVAPTKKLLLAEIADTF